MKSRKTICLALMSAMTIPTSALLAQDNPNDPNGGAPPPQPVPTPLNWRDYPALIEAPDLRIYSDLEPMYYKVDDWHNLPWTTVHDGVDHADDYWIEPGLVRSSTPTDILGPPLNIPSNYHGLVSTGPWAVQCVHGPYSYQGHSRAFLAPIPAYFYNINPTLYYYGKDIYRAESKGIDSPSYNWTLTGAQYHFTSSFYYSPFTPPEWDRVDLNYEVPNRDPSQDQHGYLDNVGTYRGLMLGNDYFVGITDENRQRNVPVGTSSVTVNVKNGSLGDQSPDHKYTYDVVWHRSFENWNKTAESSADDKIIPLPKQRPVDDEVVYYNPELDGEISSLDGLHQVGIVLNATGQSLAFIPPFEEWGGIADLVGTILGLGVDTNAPPVQHSVPCGFAQLKADLKDARGVEDDGDPTTLTGQVNIDVAPSYLQPIVEQQIENASTTSDLNVDLGNGVHSNVWNEAYVQAEVIYPQIVQNWMYDSYDEHGYDGQQGFVFQRSEKRLIRRNWEIDLSQPNSD